MATNISSEIRQAIDAQQGEPVYIVDAERRKSYVLIPADSYERIRDLFGADGMAAEDFLLAAEKPKTKFSTVPAWTRNRV